MKLKLVQFFLCILFSTTLFAQINLHGAITSNGKTFNSGGIKLNYAIGQLNNQSYTASGIQFHEGIIQQSNPMLINNLNEATISPEFSLFPNPVNDQLTIKNSMVELTFSIYNSIGKIVKSGVLENTITTEELANGIYFFRLQNKKAEIIYTSKFIKS